MLGHGPFIEAIDRDKAAPISKGITEGRFFRGRLRPSIDQPRSYAQILGPSRDEPSAQHHPFTPAFKSHPDRRRGLAGGDIIAGRKVRRNRVEIKTGGEGFATRDQCKPPTHVRGYSSSDQASALAKA
jgi:hypothetical protein